MEILHCGHNLSIRFRPIFKERVTSFKALVLVIYSFELKNEKGLMFQVSYLGQPLALGQNV